MSAVAVGLSAGSFVWVTVTVVAYFRTIPQGKVPVGISGMVLKLLVGLGLAAAAVAWSYRSGSLGAAVIAPAVVATADPELQVIRQYGVEHHKALNYTTGTFMIGGIPLGLVPSFKTMAIPTTLLVDERGVIQWIDQSDDYRVRSDDSRVRAAVLRAFGPAT